MAMSNSKDQVLEGYAQDEIEEAPKVEIPRQFEFYKVPRRFGAIPVDELPIGCDKEQQYYKLYPRVSLPFQRVERISQGHPELEPNRLFWGDNLHIMRILPSNSIDLIYIDPPFFSGRNYNVIFGDQNEVRSFTDIWEAGMPGYLVWLNARLLEMKRLLRPTGSLFIHLDWHASHYVKCELDKIFGYDNYVSEIIWQRSKGRTNVNRFPIEHDTIFWYSKSSEFKWRPIFKPLSEKYITSHYRYVDEEGRRYRTDNLLGHRGVNPVYEWRGITTYWRYPPERMDELEAAGRIRWTRSRKPEYIRYLDESEGAPVGSIWEDIGPLNSQAREAIGYPTQKPEGLLQRIVQASSDQSDIVADFFCGGGTTPVVAQRFGRRWIACDISRIAVAITADRIIKTTSESIVSDIEPAKTPIQTKLSPVPDISLEYWGTYEVPALVKLSDDEFRQFVIMAYDGRVATGDDQIHGYKNGVPLHVGSASQNNQVTKDSVLEFAKAIVTRRGRHQGEILAWSFAPSAQKAAEELAAQQALAIDFVKISLVAIESDKFSEHITRYREYENLLRFIIPPEIRLKHKRISPFTYLFDLSESISLNPGGKIANVQWDFDHRTRFVSSHGYSYTRGDKKTPLLTATFKFPAGGTRKIACRVQDDLGGERTHVMDLEVN
jgi:DNA modification methylase